jgi:hypothetical protein
MIENVRLWVSERFLATLFTLGLLAVGAVVLVLSVAGKSSSETAAVEEEAGPATIESIDGTELSRVILSEEAAERLAIETVAIEPDADSGETTIPYSAVMYDVNGNTYVYTSPEELTFVRAPVTVERLNGDMAVLADSPSAGTEIVTVGSAELFGAEFEFEEE